MTDKEIDKLEAGPELDALVAAAMEWNLCYNNDEKLPYGGIPPFDGVVTDAADFEVVPIPKFSTDIAAAWEVAEKFKLTVTPKQGATERSRWLADPELKGSDNLWLGYGPTAKVAICKAALLAMNAENSRREGETHGL